MRKAWMLTCLLVCLSGLASAGNQLQKNKEIAKRVFVEMFNQGKFEVANEIYASDFVNHGVHQDVGLKEDQDAARGWKQAFPDLVMTVDQVVAEGDLVTVLWSARGTNTGTGNGLPATGKKVEGRGITIWRISGGKIREEWSEFDQLRLMKQLGLIPASEQ